ncbi:cation:proton antiporter [Aquibacillus sp. 3ASR75-11]|uniref:Cation:proton antiporter n=1 Tax=Terrihalobacillus insolitus TaxID=2950438 RepID=A0A9X3WQD8_9BACI|nr:cation:proton antiporter family protein [Terrihalobacillus insolitus]MDC3414705.1 cation:proton antiporter [Terrihalobacillus insolitus]MDC3424182.1 cation:proton antiporter [Terrihalobacillus insolitus]
MENQSLTSLMFVVGIAFFIPIILQRFKLTFVPVVIAEIIAGLIIGESGFNIISEDPLLELLSLLGFIFLMFISGLEIDFSAFQKNNKKAKDSPSPVMIALGIFALIMTISFGLSYILVGLDLIKEPFLMTLIISTVSLGIVVPVIKEKNLTEGLLGQIILLITVIADFSTMIFLTVYAMFRDEEGQRVFLLFVLFLAVFLAYRVIHRYFQFEWFDNLLKGTVQLGTRGVFALILFFVALSETIGAENILGAFLAGTIISFLSPKKEFIHQLDSFGFGFLIPIFFVMVGVQLNIWELFVDSKILLLMPLLLVFMYIAKIIPTLILKKWYSWKETLSIGILVTSKLSLVIAASSIALELGVINDVLNGAIILVSILTCLISPITFSKMFPVTKSKTKKLKISIVGATQATMLVARDKMEEKSIVRLYSTKIQKEESEHSFPIIYVDELSIEYLEKKDAFRADKIVFATDEDSTNISLGQHALKQSIDTVVIKVENQALHQRLTEEGFAVYSTLYSTRTFLKALIDNPGLLQLITKHNNTIKEIVVNHANYDQTPLTELPFLGESLILQIYRYGQVIIPHGDTTLHEGDKLLASGREEDLREIELALS